MLNVCFLTRKGTSLRETTSFDYFTWKSVHGSGLWAVGRTRKKEAE